MKTVTSHMMALSMDDPVREIADFDAVVRLYWPRVFRFALASLRDPDAAQTVAQDCFLKAFQARDGFRGDSTLQTWLMRIAVNLVRDHVRSRRLQFWKRGLVHLANDGATIAEGKLSPEGSVLVQEQMEAVRSATARLPERQRTVFLLRFVEDMELLEIANVTGLKEGAVKIHLYRAIRSVRRNTRRLQ